MGACGPDCGHGTIPKPPTKDSEELLKWWFDEVKRRGFAVHEDEEEETDMEEDLPAMALEGLAND